MKLTKFLLTALFVVALSSAQAQIKNITTSVTLPDWGVSGYDDATYYYIPAAETYYDVRNQEYVYMKDGKWVRNSEMPSSYSTYDLYNGYKVVLTDKKEPFANHPALRAKYPKDYKGETQKTIRPRQ
jgi:hypothetical protein